MTGALGLAAYGTVACLLVMLCDVADAMDRRERTVVAYGVAGALTGIGLIWTVRGLLW